MRKWMKKAMVLATAAVMMFSMAGCGEISYDDITGDWTVKTIDGKAIEEYAAAAGVDKAQVTSNMTITDDDKLVTANATDTGNYVYERMSDGLVVKEEGSDKVLFTLQYDADAKTLSYQLDLGTGTQVPVVMEKGKADLTVPVQTEEAAGTEDGMTEDGMTEDGMTEDDMTEEDMTEDDMTEEDMSEDDTVEDGLDSEDGYVE